MKNVMSVGIDQKSNKYRNFSKKRPRESMNNTRNETPKKKKLVTSTSKKRPLTDMYKIFYFLDNVTRVLRSVLNYSQTKILLVQ